MWLLYAEMALALCILLFIVWWTMKDAPSNHLDLDTTPAQDRDHASKQPPKQAP